MAILSKIISVLPFILMILVSAGGMIVTYITNKKLDKEEANKK